MLAEEAAADLGIAVGDTVTLRHPQRTGPLSFGFVESELRVAALHPYPIRNFVYMDESGAELMGLTGVVNTVHIDPADNAADGAVERELFSVPAVASVQTVAATTQAVEDMMGQMAGIIQTMAGVILLLAMLIAFLTSSISLDARVREHATMFAYGVRVRTALRMAITESTMMGVVATLVGVAGGIGILWWMTTQLISTTLPDIGLEVTMQLSTVVVVIVLGVVAVALAPVFTVRRMRKMDLPGTLRLVE